MTLRRRTAALLCAALAIAPTAAGLPGAEGAVSARPDEDGLYLVTLDGPGIAGDQSAVPTAERSAQLRARQRAVLASVGAPTPRYSWIHALNGFAVDLEAEQAENLAADPRVSLVEPNQVRPLASRDGWRGKAPARPTPSAAAPAR